MKIEIHTVVNGRELQRAVKPNQTLLEFLRDELHLKGSMEGGTHQKVFIMYLRVLC